MAIHAPLILAFACLFALSTALPSVLNQIVSAQTGPNIPCTLLGKPYRRRWDSQGCKPWTLAVTDRNDSSADVDNLADPDRASAHQTLAVNDGWTQTEMDREPRAQLPLQIALTTSPESVPPRLRLMRSKRPLRYSPCSDEAPSSNQALPNEITPRVKNARRVQPPVVSKPEEKTDSRDPSVRVGRSKRLYDRGEWKSRLSEY